MMDINEILNKLPPAPPEIIGWIHRDLIKGSYIIYDKNKDTAVCTRCGHKFKASRFYIKHNEEGQCPRCKSRAVYKASGIGRKNLTEYFRVLVLTHRGNTVYGTLTEITANFNNEGKPELSKWLSAVYVFNHKKQEYWKHTPEGFWNSECWSNKKNVYVPRPPHGVGYYYKEERFKRTEIYIGNIENVFKKSCLKYVWMPYLFAEFNSYDYIRYIDLALKYKSIELLAKAGFENIVKEKVRGHAGSKCVNWRDQNLQKILRLPPRHIKKLKGHIVDFNILKTFQGLSEKEKMLPWQTITKIVETYNYYHFKEICQRASVVKWANWASQEGVYQGDWIDYIKDCEKLGLDTRKNSILFPENFRTVHAQISEKIDVIENKAKTEKLKIVAEDYKINVEDEQLMLYIARSQTDLNYESAKLCHCVKNYGDRIASGDTIIYFIRKKEKPDMPYYTLEIKPDGTFIQCRGKCNCSMTKEVEEFKDKVVAKFKESIKKKERSAA